MTEYWFRPKRSGFGIGIPLNWKGWALYIAYLAAIIAIPTAFQYYLGNPGTVWLRAIGVVIVSVPFVWVAWKKTKGGWRWRKGDETTDDEDQY